MIKKTLYWTPRILAILAILFMLMFSFDGFEGTESITKKLLGFLIHSIPALILTGILIIAWKQELIGGILYIFSFVVAGIRFGSFSGNSGSLIIIVPFLVTGLLFVLYHFLYLKGKQ